MRFLGFMVVSSAIALGACGGGGEGSGYNDRYTRTGARPNGSIGCNDAGSRRWHGRGDHGQDARSEDGRR